MGTQTRFVWRCSGGKDFNIGRVIDALKERIDENTIGRTSDNGPWLPTELSGGSGLTTRGERNHLGRSMREPTIFWSPEI